MSEQPRNEEKPKKPKKFRYGYIVEDEKYVRTAPRSAILWHYIDTVGWAGTTVSVVFWTAVIILAYVLIF